MRKIKITILKAVFDQELVDEYGVEGLSAYPMMKEGRVFYGDYVKPEDSCDEAWKAIYQYVFALSYGSGKELLYYGDWIRRSGVVVCGCNDRLRPIIFKLETTDQESQMDHELVRQSVFGIQTG